uniref:Peptidase M14 domain-containing protein n=1 Tax=Phaeomonas parva TaxID=124430 RepID=A0A7S1XQ31_9STRA|mmetsp:Transcript_2439/g.7244  ORF Transcript_2439/g.7244 Transcript_2439/m.7244 type:complete len:118 (+) Transcript_2439:361-714(+)
MSPWGYTSDKPTDYATQNAGSEAAVKALEAVHGTRYEYGPISTTIYPASGSSADYTYGECGVVYSYGVELRDTGEYGFTLPPEYIVPSGEETFEGVKALAKYVAAQKDAAAPVAAVA